LSRPIFCLRGVGCAVRSVEDHLLQNLKCLLSQSDEGGSCIAVRNDNDLINRIIVHLVGSIHAACLDFGAWELNSISEGG
jgi:hypothetical protein